MFVANKLVLIKEKGTYADYNYDNIWKSLFVFHKLFTETAQKVGWEYGFDFPQEECQRAVKFLKHVKDLPQNAETIFKTGRE